MEGTLNSVTASSSASDARPDLDDAQVARWEAFEPDGESESEHITVATAQPLATSLKQVLTALHLLGEALVCASSSSKDRAC